LTLSSGGGELFFGEPALELQDWLAFDEKGRGFINILDCVTLFQSPLLYSTFLFCILSALYEMMPEVGDLDKPKMVFFFDEAHLLFTDAPKTLLQKIEQVVRLIRSKGVGIYFITQSPSDIPDTVLSQLGNKIQHALRAYTPKDQKAVKAAAASFRANPEFSSETVLGELSTGEALISVLDEKGAPEIVQRAFMLPPRSFLGTAEPEMINGLTRNCPLYSKYARSLDRESAYEVLQKQKQQQATTPQKKQPVKAPQSAKPKTSARGTSVLNKAASSAMNQIGREVGKALIRGLLGNMKK
jgi:DNA helicase HerA-like ATPase